MQKDLFINKYPLFKLHPRISMPRYVMAWGVPNYGRIGVLCEVEKKQFDMEYVDEWNSERKEYKPREYEYKYCPFCGQKLEKVEEE